MTDHAAVQARLRAHALGFPGAWEDFPWESEAVAKVGKKVFVFLGHGEGQVGMSVKLPHSMLDALERPFARPTGYGLGRYGWVSCSFGPEDDPPVETLLAWIEESYRAVAPKKLIKQLDEAG